ncbi:hypothetical protein BVG16_03350 [Paenibacillus selenitireducens]|uniref:DUF2627 domain-containing protein n=1 Tax=Paenibacillus selenitireducens TaxID=1324314 RepID=A0A1T2XND6_9BACL|nr:DUF2627 domain-containing protein [Paenibacillus selenitireducens]OPA81361.1 hypothetical protein BVG16_03350 [Paenibacillus selenitireducens]
MKIILARFIAILLLVIPGLAATYGFVLMKDALFNYFSAHGDTNLAPDFGWLGFSIGFVLFAAGIVFIGGWTFYRDRKRNYVAPRFKKKRVRPQ